jgi:flagellar brake protein
MIASGGPDYALRHRGEILSILDRLRRDRVLTTVEFGDGHAIVSTLLEVRRDASTLVFDIARDATTNDALFAASNLAFVAELDGIQIAFATKAPSPVSIADGPAALVAMPETVTRLQRREWFRVALPAQPPVRCTVLDAGGNARPARAVDLSCGGVGVILETPFVDVRAGGDHEVIVSLPEIGRLDLEATLRTVHPAVANGDDRGSPGNGVRLGFRFEHLPPKTASQIQRYVQRLELEQLRLLRGKA